MSIAHHSRVRLAHRPRTRREPCCWAEPPGGILDGLYTALRDPDGTWTLHNGRTRIISVADPAARRVLAAAMLADAFPDRTIRLDLIEAFAAELPDSGFILPTDLVAGWALRWSLDQPE